MRVSGAPFYIQYYGNQVKVEPYSNKGKDVFHIHLDKPLFITLAAAFEGGHHWTSVPQGRQAEAERLGELIDEYRNSPKAPPPNQGSLF